MMSSCRRSRRFADVVEALRLLGVGVDESVPSVKVGLADSAVGAAERNALATEQHARSDGAGPAEFGEQVGVVLDGAACRNDLEFLALLEWRITRTTQALQLLSLSGPRGDVDPLARTILLTTAALNGRLAAAVTMRNPHRPATATRDSARALRAAVNALDEAAADVRKHDISATPPTYRLTPRGPRRERQRSYARPRGSTRTTTIVSWGSSRSNRTRQSPTRRR